MPVLIAGVTGGVAPSVVLSAGEQECGIEAVNIHARKHLKNTSVCTDLYLFRRFSKYRAFRCKAVFRLNTYYTQCTDRR